MAWATHKTLAPLTMAEADTVEFNLAGRHFEVSRNLVAHSEMLETLVSDTWNHDPGSAIFIDRDGDLFAQILNYLRYGSIELPITIPRTMFERELDYYGITPADGITSEETLGGIMRSFTVPFPLAKTKHEMFFLALECYHKFGQIAFDSPNTDKVHVQISQGHKLYNGKSLDPEEKKLLDEYLGRYFGMSVAANSIAKRNGNGFYVCTKK